MKQAAAVQCSSGRAGLCAKGGSAMGLIPLVQGPSGKGGGGVSRMETHNIQLHGAFTAAAAKGDSDSSSRPRQWSCWEIQVKA